MQAKEMWEKFIRETNRNDMQYEMWAFGDAPDELAELVLRGEKTGTSSAYALYELEGEPLPKEGSYSVVLDSRDAMSGM